MATNDGGIPINFDDCIFTKTAPSGIRHFADIPDIAAMEIPAVEYLVPALGIARNTITLWTGPDGDGKTYLLPIINSRLIRFIC